MSANAELSKQIIDDNENLKCSWCSSSELREEKIFIDGFDVYRCAQCQKLTHVGNN